MCMFVGEVEEVSKTSIFARFMDGRQCLVYEMTLSTPQETAMILPIPVARGSSEDAVRFIDLSDCRSFFMALDQCFPRREEPEGAPMADAVLAGAEPTTLKVHSVGSFEASYVPCIADFERLDERFRLPSNLWSQMPQYHGYGFAVFKLKAGNQRPL